MMKAFSRGSVRDVFPPRTALSACRNGYFHWIFTGGPQIQRVVPLLYPRMRPAVWRRISLSAVYDRSESQALSTRHGLTRGSVGLPAPSISFAILAVG